MSIVVESLTEGDVVEIVTTKDTIRGMVTWVNDGGKPPYAMIRKVTGQMASVRDRDIVKIRRVVEV